jgi:SAM-dependent methyltransferase
MTTDDTTLGHLFSGGDLVIDLGCGDGSWLDAVAPKYKAAVGVDIDRVAFESRGRAPNAWTFLQADLDKGLPFKDATADAIRANQVIEHVREPGRFLAEAQRVLRPGGLLVVTTPNVRQIRHLIRLVIFGRGPMTSAHDCPTRAWDDGHLHYLTPGDLGRIARDAAFSSVRVEALISPIGQFRIVRPVVARLAGWPAVREFLSGNALLIARR